MSRATLHATRRAAEMREAQALVQELGVEPIMTSAIAARQQDLSDRGLAAHFKSSVEPSIADYLDVIGKTAKHG